MIRGNPAGPGGVGVDPDDVHVGQRVHLLRAAHGAYGHLDANGNEIPRVLFTPTGKA